MKIFIEYSENEKNYASLPKIKIVKTLQFYKTYNLNYSTFSKADSDSITKEWIRCAAKFLIWCTSKLVNIYTVSQYVRRRVPLKFKVQLDENHHSDCLTHVVWDHGLFKCWTILINYAKIKKIGQGFNSVNYIQ